MSAVSDADPDGTEKEVEGRISARLKEVGVREDCPLCGNRAWFLMSSGSQWFRLKGMGVIAPNDWRIEMACTNCGFIRQHSDEVLFELSRRIDAP
jgi:hypothetical protein